MPTHVDPVCGMNVEEAEAAARRDYQGQTIFFCAVGCAETFDREPSKYVATSETRRSWFRRH